MENKQLVEYKEGFISKVRKFLQEIDGNKEALNKLSIDRLKKLEKYYDNVIKENEKKIIKANG